MTRYDIYGIGGALVDTEVRVSEQFLDDYRIEKGIMTLVDETRQKELLDALSSNKLKLLRKCGGSVCNSVVAASMLGAKTFFSGKVANDVDGQQFISDLNKAGVNFHCADQDYGITGTCLVMVTQDAERTMNTFLGINDDLSSKELDRIALKNSGWFYVEGYLVANQSRTVFIKEAVEFAKENHVKIALTLSDPSIVGLFGDALRDVIGGGIDLLFCNKDEALAFAGTDDLASAIDRLKCLTKTLAVTDGANGAITFDGDSLLKSKGVVAKAIDTNGAGDMFAGAFLYSITLGKSYDWAASFANHCAARVVEQFGPRVELKDLTLIKKKFGI